MSTAHRYPAAWRGVAFNAHLDGSGITDDETHVNTQLNSYISLTSLDATRVETTDYRELRQWLEGAEANEAYEGVMVAFGSGQILASSEADLEDKTALMRSQFAASSVRIAAAGADPVGVLPFYFSRATAAGKLDLLLYARPSSGRPVIIGRRDEGMSRGYRFALVAFDAKFYSQTEQSVACATAGSTVLTNAGDMYSQPRIIVVTTGGSSTIKVTIGGSSANSVTFTGVPAGTWTLDTRRSTITKADGTNGMQYRTAGFLSTLFLMNGSNTFDTTGSSGLTSVTTKFRDAYA